jgi:hypothetical protein
MKKQTIASIILCAGAAIGLTTPAHAGDISATVAQYDSVDGYDYVNTFPPATYQNIGTFTFTLPPGLGAASITISGSFGDLSVSPTTAQSDYYLGFAGDEEAVTVANCDSPTADCTDGEEGPYDWSLTLTPSEIFALASGLSAGSIDFGFTWDAAVADGGTVEPVYFGDTPQFQYIDAGEATLDITPSPEPATVLFCFSGLAGLAAFRRFRKP